MRCVALTSSGGIVVGGGFDRKVTLHNIEAGTQVSHFACGDVVRSVHLSADASRLAVGSEMQGKGGVRLFDVNQSKGKELLHRWEHAKPVRTCVRLATCVRLCAHLFSPRLFSRPLRAPAGASQVWCVRLSPDASILAAAGYDMKMTGHRSAA